MKWRSAVRRRGPPRCRPALRQAGRPPPPQPPHAAPSSLAVPRFGPPSPVLSAVALAKADSARVAPTCPPPSRLARPGFGPFSAIETLCLYGSFFPFCHSVKNAFRRGLTVSTAQARSRSVKPRSSVALSPGAPDPRPETLNPRPQNKKNDLLTSNPALLVFPSLCSG